MTAPLRAFLDSNVLISAALGGTNDFRLFWELPDVDVVTSQYCIGEVSRNLPRAEHRARLWQLLYQSHLVPDDFDGKIPAELTLPAKDLPIVQAAFAGKADVLVSGDRNHFGMYWGRSYEGLMIESPRMFKSRYPDIFKERV